MPQARPSSAVQCVASPGGSPQVSATTRCARPRPRAPCPRLPGLVAQEPVDPGLGVAPLPTPTAGRLVPPHGEPPRHRADRREQHDRLEPRASAGGSVADDPPPAARDPQPRRWGRASGPCREHGTGPSPTRILEMRQCTSVGAKAPLARRTLPAKASVASVRVEGSTLVNLISSLSAAARCPQTTVTDARHGRASIRPVVSGPRDPAREELVMANPWTKKNPLLACGWTAPTPSPARPAAPPRRRRDGSRPAWASSGPFWSGGCWPTPSRAEVEARPRACHWGGSVASAIRGRAHWTIAVPGR